MTPRERLLEATIRCLEEHGYAQTTTRQIVAAADMHLPTVNYYFGSKERLLHDAVVEAVRRWGQTTMGAVGNDPADGPGQAGQLHRSLQRFLSTLDEDRRYVVAAAEAFAQAERSDELRERLSGAYGEFREVVARSIAPDSPQADAVLAMSSVLIALFDGLAIQWLINPDNTPTPDQIVASLVALAHTAEKLETEER